MTPSLGHSTDNEVTSIQEIIGYDQRIIVHLMSYIRDFGREKSKHSSFGAQSKLCLSKIFIPILGNFENSYKSILDFEFQRKLT